MGSVRLHSTRGTLFLDFRHQGRRCREYTALPHTPANRQRLQRALKRIEQQIAEGTFDYQAMFPPPAKPNTSPSVDRAQTSAASRTHNKAIESPTTPAFNTFIEQWIRDHAVEWRRSHLRTLRSTVDSHLLPAFGDRLVGVITREEILALPSLPMRWRRRASPSTAFGAQRRRAPTVMCPMHTPRR